MLHLNEEIKASFYKSPSLQKMGWLMQLPFMPETYVLTTIDDFVKNAESIRLTRKILPFGSFFNNKAMIIFTNIKYRRTSKKLCEIWDMNNSLEARILIPDDEIKEISDGTLLDSAYIVFSPKNQTSLLWFINYSVFENQAADRNKYLIPGYASA
jgi:hypothetical protein